MFCPYCGKQIEEDARFCSGCGRELKAEPKPASPAPEMPKPVEPVSKAPTETPGDQQIVFVPIPPQPSGGQTTTTYTTRSSVFDSIDKRKLMLAAALFLILIVAILLLWFVFFGTGTNKSDSKSKTASKKTTATKTETVQTTASKADSSDKPAENSSYYEQAEENYEYTYEEESTSEAYASTVMESSCEEVYEEPSEYILPYSAERYLTYNDLYNLSKDECRLARNELYARHGRKFSDESLQAYFNSKSWYYPSINPEDFTESMLNDIEVYNRDLIVQFEKEMGYR